MRSLIRIELHSFTCSATLTTGPKIIMAPGGLRIISRTYSILAIGHYNDGLKLDVVRLGV